ncbi:hypothetical protein BU24DRAFT_493477 [Aaosphaeria arxii CBS 175.79]|uniref:DUF1772-domain-containing protein n=1 Tax=Aaosphaeria arxii CBS 175.79 TaxID=1450172 RepID=A0A6A5XQF4_9PLEO|nr:uncharacterized protein BU24DRAFT_493477 [Aaosphaeria arxii CBS 175.79]KAF2014991.1 hypothetical protein BU24DRAFT_493477 [Aaosphaeria arxii CBS 175.79]
MASIDITVQLLSLSSALVLSGYHYASDAVALPNALLSSSLSSSDIVHAWLRAWDVGRVIGPLCVNVSLAGYAFVAYREGPESTTFWYYVAASAAQVVNVLYTVFGVFPVNDLLLAESEKIKAGEKLQEKDTVRRWVQQWKDMDRNRMILMWSTALLGLAGLWRAT